jgi:hypothetical protein
VIATDADGAALDQPVDDRVGVGAVADDVTEMPRGIDAPGRSQHRVEGEEVAVDVRDDDDPHTNQSSSDPFTTAAACARRDRAGTHPARARRP